MTVSTATLLAKISALEARLAAAATKLKADEVTIATMQANITSLFADFSSVSALAGNASFLANLSQLPHQTTSNSTISTGAGSLSNADRVAINGAINALNTLQSNAQSNGFEA